MKEINFTADLKTLGLPLATILVLALVFIFGIRIGLSQIQKINSSLEVAKKNETILTQKESLLASLSGQITSQASLVTRAFPSRNPSLAVLAQIRTLALEKGLLLTNIKAGGEVKDKSGLSRVDVNFDIDGSIQSVLDFTNAVKSLAPLTKVAKADIAVAEAGVRGSLMVKSFWAPYPTKITAVGEAVKDLTEEEKKVLGTLEDLRTPLFMEMTPALPSERVNPFGQ